MLLSVAEGDRRQPVIAFAPRESDPLDVLRAALARAPHGVIVCGEDGTILFVNGLASAIFDYPPDELIGQPLSRLLPGAWRMTISGRSSGRTRTAPR